MGAVLAWWELRPCRTCPQRTARGPQTRPAHGFKIAALGMGQARGVTMDDEKSVFGAAALAITGSVATQALVGTRTISTPFGDLPAGAAIGIGGLWLAKRSKKKSTRRKLLYGAIGSLSGQAAVQTYKMEIDVFSMGSDMIAGDDEG